MTQQQTTHTPDRDERRTIEIRDEELRSVRPARFATGGAKPEGATAGGMARSIALPTEPYVVDASELARYRPLTLRVLAGLIWLASFVGTVLAVDYADGASAAMFSSDFFVAAIIALAVQAALTTVQLVTCANWRSGWYLGSVGISSLMSFLGYRTLIAVPVTNWILGGASDPFAGVTSVVGFGALLASQPSYIIGATVIHLGVLAALVVVDIVPERIFVRR